MSYTTVFSNFIYSVLSECNLNLYLYTGFRVQFCYLPVVIGCYMFSGDFSCGKSGVEDLKKNNCIYASCPSLPVCGCSFSVPLVVVKSIDVPLKQEQLALKFSLCGRNPESEGRGCRHLKKEKEQSLVWDPQGVLVQVQPLHHNTYWSIWILHLEHTGQRECFFSKLIVSYH